MSTPFLAGFAEAVVKRLISEKAIEIAPGTDDRVTWFVANWLDTRARGGSVLSSLEAALLACPEVTEVYVDLDQLKAVVDDLA